MLKGKQKRFLRGLGHPLSPVVQIGKHELSDSLIAETDAALETHELIKVKILETCMLDRKDAADTLAAACSAGVAQILGKTFLLYRPAKKPSITLPQ